MPSNQLRTNPAIVRLPAETTDELMRVTPLWLPGSGGLAMKIRWLIEQAGGREASTFALVRDDLIARLRKRCPPCYMRADASTLTNWAVGRYLDIVDRYYDERAKGRRPKADAEPTESQLKA